MSGSGIAGVCSQAIHREFTFFGSENGHVRPDTFWRPQPQNGKNRIDSACLEYQPKATKSVQFVPLVCLGVAISSKKREFLDVYKECTIRAPGVSRCDDPLVDAWISSPI